MNTPNFITETDIDSLSNAENSVGYLSINTPEELIIAAGKRPVRLFGMGKPAKLANTYLPKTFDPYVLDCLECALDGTYDSLNGVIVANISDAHRRLYDAWKQTKSSTNVFFLDVPKGADKPRMAAYRHDLSLLVNDIEQAFSTKITNDKLNEAIKLCNKTRQLLSDLNDLRKNNIPPFTGAAFFNIVKWAQTNDKKIVNDALEKYLNDLKDKNNTASKDCELPRIMVIGSFMGSNNIVTTIEKMDARVVCEDLCAGMQYFKNRVDENNAAPLDAIAQRYLSIPTARMVETELRWDYLLQTAEDFNVDGVIYFALKFDDIYLFEYPHIRDKFQKAGYPLLFIEAENFTTSMGQIDTRAQAFIEMLDEGSL